MKIDDLIDELTNVIETAHAMPLSGGRCLIDPERIRTIIFEMRDSLPKELKQAKAIVADRTEIISEAKKEAETIVRSAEDRRRAMLNQSDLVKQAQQQANEIISDAKAKAREIRKASNDYVEDIIKRADEALSSQLAEIKKTRQSLKATMRTTK